MSVSLASLARGATVGSLFAVVCVGTVASFQPSTTEATRKWITWSLRVAALVGGAVGAGLVLCGYLDLTTANVTGRIPWYYDVPAATWHYNLDVDKYFLCRKHGGGMCY